MWGYIWVVTNEGICGGEIMAIGEEGGEHAKGGKDEGAVGGWKEFDQ